MNSKEILANRLETLRATIEQNRIEKENNNDKCHLDVIFEREDRELDAIFEYEEKIKQEYENVSEYIAYETFVQSKLNIEKQQKIPNFKTISILDKILDRIRIGKEMEEIRQEAEY